MSSVQDGPSSSLFNPMALEGNVPLSGLTDVGISNEMALVLEHAPSGACIGWGIPFEIGSSTEATEEFAKGRVKKAALKKLAES